MDKKVTQGFPSLQLPQGYGAEAVSSTVPKAAKLPSAVFTCGTKRRSELLPREEVPRETHGETMDAAMGGMAGSRGMAESQWENGKFLCLAGKFHGSVGHFGHFGHVPICLTGKNHGFNTMMANIGELVMII